MLAGGSLSASCGDQTRQGQTSSYLVLTALEGASGAEPGTFGTVAQLGRHHRRQQVRDDLHRSRPGARSSWRSRIRARRRRRTRRPRTTSSRSTQYHVEYVRSDGHNVAGRGRAVRVRRRGHRRLSRDTRTVAFTLVRNQAKLEAPLKALGLQRAASSRRSPKVTFYGHDQTGREVSATGNIEVSFANFGDSASSGG